MNFRGAIYVFWKVAMNSFQICQYLWLVFAAIWLAWAFGTKKMQRRASFSSRMVYGLLAVAGYYLMFGRHFWGPRWLAMAMFPRSRWTDIAGLVTTALGLGLAICARAYLGRNWSSVAMVKVDHELVRSGPYKFVRHPIYSGIILAMVGTALALAQWRGVLAIIVVYLGFKIKSLIEERLMVATFGTQYEQYRQSTGAIVPKLF